MFNIISLFVPIIIYSFGYSIIKILEPILNKNFSRSDLIQGSILIGTSFVVIIPIIIGMNANSNFSYYFYFLIALGSLSFIFLIKNTLFYLLFHYNLHFSIKTDEKDIILLTIGSLLGLFFLMTILPPLRGFDALWRYFSDALVFYQENKIPVINYLYLSPISYEPLNSLLYTFSFYMTNSTFLFALPFLYVIGFLFLVYELAFLYFNDRKKSLYSISIIIATPFFHWLIDFWIYYQELYLLYFFSLGMFFIIRLIKGERTRTNYFFLFLSVILTIFSKFNGWILVIILLLLIPLGRFDKIIKGMFLLALGSLIAFQGATITYILIIIPILFFSLICVISLYYQEKSRFDYKTTTFSLISIFLGILVGFIWIDTLISRFGFIQSVIIEKYFSISQISYNFSIFTSNSIVTIEQMQATDLITSIFVFILANAFGPWLIPKLFGFKKEIKNYELYLWIFIPVIIWLDQLSQTNSIRYLAPILIPITLVTVSGIYELWEYIKLRFEFVPNNPPTIYLLSFFLAGIFFYYPYWGLIFFLKFPLSLDSLGSSLEQSYWFSSTWYGEIIINFLIFFLIIAIIYLAYSEKIKLKINLFLYLRKFRSYFSVLFIIFIILLTAHPYSFVYIFSFGNTNLIDDLYDPATSSEFMQVTDFLISENVINTTILTAKIPGIGFYTNLPTIDLNTDPTIFEPVFVHENVSEGLFFINNPFNYIQNLWNISNKIHSSVGYFVLPNYNNPYYTNLLNLDDHLSYIYLLPFDNLIFTKVLENDKFIVFQTNKFSNSTFIGIVNVNIVDGNSKLSLLHNGTYEPSKNAQLEVVLDLSSVLNTSEKINFQISYKINQDFFTKNITITSPDSSNFTTISIPLLNFSNDFSLLGFKFSINPQVNILLANNITAQTPILINLSGNSWKISDTNGFSFASDYSK